MSDQQIVKTSDVAHYSANDVTMTETIKKWLLDNDKSRAWLAGKVRKASSTIGQVLNQKYPVSPTNFLNQMLAIIQVETERIQDGSPGYVEGSVHKLIGVVCDRTRKHANFGVLVGNVGIGKTFTLKEYQNRHHQTVLVEANPSMSPTMLMQEILRSLGVNIPLGLDQQFQEVINALFGTNHLLIIDEAENLQPRAMHYIRRVRDKAQIGVVLSGTTKLNAILKPENGQFEQIRSRVSMWPNTITRITRDDADEMARAGLGEMGEVSDDVLTSLWSYCGGSARVLMESLVPSIRDYIGTRPLNVALVDGVARDILSLKAMKVDKA